MTSPVYPPFFDVHDESRTVCVDVPLLRENDGWILDLDGIERAFADGAVAILLCNPHNPTGTAHTTASLAELARIAERHGAVVISDEIHAPLALPGRRAFTPFLEAGPEAADVGIAIHSASKTFNLAGLKCAHFVTVSDRLAKLVADMPMEVEWRTGLFGIKAGIAAYTEEMPGWTLSSPGSDRTRRSSAACSPSTCPVRNTCRATRGSSRGSTCRRSVGARIPPRRSWPRRGLRSTPGVRSARPARGSCGSTTARGRAS